MALVEDSLTHFIHQDCLLNLFACLLQLASLRPRFSFMRLSIAFELRALVRTSRTDLVHTRVHMVQLARTATLDVLVSAVAIQENPLQIRVLDLFVRQANHAVFMTVDRAAYICLRLDADVLLICRHFGRTEPFGVCWHLAARIQSVVSIKFLGFEVSVMVAEFGGVCEHDRVRPLLADALDGHRASPRHLCVLDH